MTWRATILGSGGGLRPNGCSDRRWRIQQQTLGKDHPDTLASLGNLAAYLNAQERYGDAAGILNEVIEARRRVLGADHPSTLVSLGNLGFSYHRMGDHARAEAIYLEALALQRRVNGEKHPRTALVASNLADLYVQLHRYEEAEPVAISAHEGYLYSLGPASADTQKTVKLLIEVYKALGESSKASQWRAKLAGARVESK